MEVTETALVTYIATGLRHFVSDGVQALDCEGVSSFLESEAALRDNTDFNATTSAVRRIQHRNAQSVIPIYNHDDSF